MRALVVKVGAFSTALHAAGNCALAALMPDVGFGSAKSKKFVCCCPMHDLLSDHGVMTNTSSSLVNPNPFPSPNPSPGSNPRQGSELVLGSKMESNDVAKAAMNKIWGILFR